MPIRRLTNSRLRGAPTASTNRSKTRDKVRTHREKLRRLGLRPIEIWVPDVTSPAFVREARRQSKRLAKDPDGNEVQAWIDSLQHWSRP